MRSYLHSPLALCATALVTMAGCGGGGSTLNTVPVSGTVTMDGKPVEGAVVTFSPEGDGHAASGTTDATGKYILTTETDGDGAVPGSYQVMVTKYESAPQSMYPEDDIDAAYAAAEAAGENVTGTAPRAEPGAKSQLPAKYAAPTTSGLTATVTEEGANTFAFELEK